MRTGSLILLWETTGIQTSVAFEEKVNALPSDNYDTNDIAVADVAGPIH